MMPHEQTVLVFGATGQQGGSVASALRSAGWRVKALVRSADKALIAGREKLFVSHMVRQQAYDTTAL